jgi:hypothetical protein
MLNILRFLPLHSPEVNYIDGLNSKRIKMLVLIAL